jgi:hypothetical protein
MAGVGGVGARGVTAIFDRHEGLIAREVGDAAEEDGDTARGSIFVWMPGAAGGVDGVTMERVVGSTLIKFYPFVVVQSDYSWLKRGYEEERMMMRTSETGLFDANPMI